MKIKNTRFFPYPVLSSMYDDYQNCSFNIDLKAKQGKKYLYIDITPETNSETLLTLLNNKNAEIIVHFECGRTRFRTTRIIENKQTTSIEFNSGDLNEDLEVVAFIISKENIYNFACINNEFNSEYGNATFNIEKGSILAISNQKVIPIPKSIYDLSNVNSIISIISKQDDDDSKGIEINLSDKKIRVLLPKNTYIDYSGIGRTENKYTPILHTMFVFPALLYALDYLKALGEENWIDVESNLWFKVIKKKIEEKHGCFDQKLIEKYTSVFLSQELIENPYPIAVNTLLGMEEK